MRVAVTESDRRIRLLAAAFLWLLVGSALLLSTLVPAHNDLFGWAPAFWLVGAPLTVMLTLEPSLPLQMLRLRRGRNARRRSASQLVWN